IPWADVEGSRSRSWNGQRLPHARMAQRRLAVRRDEAVAKSPLGKAPGLGRGPAPRASSETTGSSWRRPRVPCPARGTYPRIAFRTGPFQAVARNEEHTSELQSLRHLVCRLLLEKKKT